MPAINIDDYGGASTFKWTHRHLVKILTGDVNSPVTNPRLKVAFRAIDRADFVPEKLLDVAYEDRELDVGYGASLDKPTTIAQMLNFLDPFLDGNYLDVGTGSGWAAALLAFATGVKGKVFSVERVQFLVDLARINIEKYDDINNLEIIFRDGSKGLPERAPYDGIHSSVAYKKIPEVLKEQLKIGGKLVSPTIEDDIRVIERINENEFVENVHEGYFFEEVIEGIS